MTDADDVEFENLPSGTATVKLLHKSLACSVPKDRDLPDHVDVRHTPGMRHNNVVRFEAGDSVEPLDLADRCWSGFSERLAAFDADGNRLDSPSRGEANDFDSSLYKLPGK